MARQSMHPGVRQDGKGQWWVDFRWKRQRIRRAYDEEGLQLQGREHAERTHRALLHKLETGQTIGAPRRGPKPRECTIIDPPARAYTVGDACLSYIQLTIRKRSAVDINRACRMWIRLFGTVPVDKLSSMDLEKAREQRAAESSNTSANRDLAYLRAAIRKAVRADLCRRDPTASLAKLPEPPGRKQRLRGNQGQALWDTLKSDQDRRLVLVIVNTGLRRGNACALEWDWIDWGERLIDIPRTKNGDSLTIPLNSVAHQALLEQREVSGHTPWVWLSHRLHLGTPSPLNASWWWKKRLRPALVSAGLIEKDDCGRMPSFRTHDLRHTFGSRATASGVHLQATKELLGHSSVQVTERYSHLDLEQLRQATEAAAWRPSETVLDTVHDDNA